ncbi:MAG: chromosome segregation protein SMC [Alphaproteobacteria bacterium]|nr:chromosome segregation protein SMC [Alphaproteobacteria bacterium]
MRFNRLRLSGFKSFVEPTELEFGAGLTGLVGPNGCGKSNLVEALRWVMGETSAKQMRGAEMDSVIFGGTSNRPARNLAEVSLALDNTMRDAPTPFNQGDEIEVARRIERDKGSLYRVNGSEVRQRDLQHLFADLSTGARSTAIVGQGRVATLIAAKPTDRRLLLEEAAGVTGLHARRHEAELRLKAAEANLERLDDVLRAHESQLRELKRQARHARRWRTLSTAIRRAEAIVHLARFRSAEAEVEAAREALAAAEIEVAATATAASAATTAREAAAETLPSLRMAAAEASAELQRLTLARAEMEAAERRLEAEQIQVKSRLAQLTLDLERETALKDDAARALDALRAEQNELTAAGESESARREAAAGALTAATATAARLDAGYRDRMHAIAEAQARLEALTEEGASLARRAEAIEGQRKAAEDERTRLASANEGAEVMAAASAAITTRGAEAEAAHGALANAEAAASAAREAEQAARTAQVKAGEAHARLRAEASALIALLAADASGQFPPVLDQVEVEPGFEAALGAALGDDLKASERTEAPRHWRALAVLPAIAPLPEGARPLAQFVKAPRALARRISQIGLVADAAEGERLSPRLRPGQRLVTPDGWLWRWDGFTIQPGAPDSASAQLRHRNRLIELERFLKAEQTELERAAARLAEATAAAGAAQQAERSWREAARQADTALAAARAKHASLAESRAAGVARLDALTHRLAELTADLAANRSRRDAIASAQAPLAQATADGSSLAQLRVELDQAVAAERAARADHDGIERAAAERLRRLEALARDEDGWSKRHDGARTRIAELVTRRAATEAEAAALAERPAVLTAQREALFDALERMEAARRAAGDRLAVAEDAYAEASKLQRAAEAAAIAAREIRVRAEGALAQAEQAEAHTVERIAERLNCEPEALAEVIAGDAAGAGEDVTEMKNAAAAEEKLAVLTGERDALGPVNLRAEEETEELDRRITNMQTEREDLSAAVRRLRQGIGELNREGRDRIQASFEQVDAHFQRLFATLFGGGKAKLELQDGEDPLAAGLEVFASPPGKKLQTLSLLSGGEQALTAIALIFAVFLTAPAPICILDEVDAALDDSNVGRFCDLLNEITRTTETRFLVVTHHRVTMARMDRLYGVTMAERGVSQLVSVDLAGVQTLRKIA